MSYIGTNKVGKMYLGSTAIGKAYLGDDLVYQKTGAQTGYVTSGLVFHLDGEDATTAQWVDKIGGITFTMNNVTLDGNGGVVFNGSSSYGNYPNNLDFPSSTHTIEIVLNGTQGAVLRVAFMINASDKLAFGYSSSGDYIVTKSGNSNARSTWGTTIKTGIHVLSVTPSVAYDNGRAMTAVNTDTWFLRTGGTFVGSRSADNAFFKGTIYQIRVYNRALTANEILHNHAIDISKYNITTT